MPAYVPPHLRRRQQQAEMAPEPEPEPEPHRSRRTSVLPVADALQQSHFRGIPSVELLRLQKLQELDSGFFTLCEEAGLHGACRNVRVL